MKSRDVPNQDKQPKPDTVTSKYCADNTESQKELDLSLEAWEASKDNDRWDNDPKRRLAIRTFSRGLLGAAFFVAGQKLAAKWMQATPYHAEAALLEQKNPLQVIAKIIDTVVGKPISATVGAVAGKEMGMRAVRFRPTRYKTFGKEIMGRSLGDEVVNITFDFFCASVGDALGRDIVGWFDPHVKKTWMDEHGHIKIPEALQATAKALTRYVTYNGGEDWAVGIPYAYFMKGQRSLINKVSPGFIYDFDRARNGASFKIRDNHIVGNYNMEGLLDLQSRFTVYNIGTLMYREAYDYVNNKLCGRPDNLYGAPDQEKPKSLIGKAGDILKWGMRSAVKGLIIMTPAVPFFWITRTPQTKHKGAFIDAEKGILSHNGDVFYADTPFPKGSAELDYLQFRQEPHPNPKYPNGTFDHFQKIKAGTLEKFEQGLIMHPGNPQRNSFDAYARTFGPADTALNAIGKANYKAANIPDGAAAWADRNLGAAGRKIKNGLGIRQFEDFTRPMVYAAASYTPYMYAKAEFANLWDDGKMDMAAERMIDGALGFNWKEFKAGVGEVWSSILRRPLADPAREREGKRREMIDTSAPDIFTETQAQREAKKNRTWVGREDARKNEKTSGSAPTI